MAFGYIKFEVHFRQEETSMRQFYICLQSQREKSGLELYLGFI